MQTYNPSLTGRLLKTLLLKTLTGLEKKSLIEKLATYVTSDGASESYPWIGEAPMIREQTDDTVQNAPMSDALYTITNKTFTGSVVVRRQDLEDDQTGGLKIRIAQLAQSAMQHKNSLLTAALVNGTSSTLGLGYDANAFFSDTHPNRGASGAQDNLLAGAGITTANIQTDINQAFAAMVNLLAENGEPYHEDPTDFVIVAPPALMKPIKEALNISEYPDRTQAQLGGMNITPLFLPRLTATDVTDWYFLHVGGAVKPLIFQDRVPITFESLEDGTDVAVRREQYVYKVRGRYNVGYGPWQNAMKVVNS